MLHGNPAVDIFNGLKLAAGGELGIGVGEEDWGSGEREVLEGLIGDTNGLVDLVVSRFGEAAPEDAIVPRSSGRPVKPLKPNLESQQWLGIATAPRPSDGVIFSGVGAITRTSLRDISGWMQWVHSYGEDTYGVHEHPNSAHRQKRRKLRSQVVNDKAKGMARDKSKSAPNHVQTSYQHSKLSARATSEQQNERPIGIPAPIVSAVENSSTKASTPAKALRNSSKNRTHRENEPIEQATNVMSGTDTLMKYLTLGVYGSSRGISSAKPAVHKGVSDDLQQEEVTLETDDQDGAFMQHIDPKAEQDPDEEDVRHRLEESKGRFIIGLQGGLQDDAAEADSTNAIEPGTDNEDGSADWNNRTLIRTLHVELGKPRVSDEISDHNDEGAWIEKVPR